MRSRRRETLLWEKFGRDGADARPLPHSPCSGKPALGLFKLWDPAYPEGPNQTIR